MKRKTILLTSLLSPLFLISSSLMAFTTMGPDSCTINDDCQQAITISGVVSDEGFVCISGCNQFASPEILDIGCGMNTFPTVWYKLTLDGIATVLNIEVTSTEIESPSIALFQDLGGCNNLAQVPLTGSYLQCIMGADGKAKAIGTAVGASTPYYLAISSINSIGGNFELCVNTQSKAFNCVIDRDIEIKSRSNGGPLEGPFDPGETISICLNVNEYTALDNGCQWFQGIVPAFGNGWDPSSFTAVGQPKGALINNDTIGKIGNGLYGTATWDWFTDVDYHHDRPNVNVSDLDNNGTLDMCNSQHEVDCPSGSISGGCCNPCWGAPLGTILPGGWFAYGINGSCNIPGPPIRGDWGDGNSCGGPMGPWSFCFDLTTRSLPDCMVDSTRSDLTIGFYTFADGETGAWTGSGSVCALDHPVKLSLQAKCGRVSISAIEQLPELCSGDIFEFLLDEPDILRWEWNISPYWAVPYPINQGDNGFMIEAPLVNNTGEPMEVSGTLIGYASDGSNDKVIRQFTFTLKDSETCETVSTESAGGLKENSQQLRVYPVPAIESIILEWSFILQKDAKVNIYNAHGILQESITVSPTDLNQKRISTENLASGIYYISLGNGDFRYVTRMVKM